jgi:hypothetical protein
MRLGARLERGRKELLLVGEGEHEGLIERGFEMVRNAFFKMLDLYFEKTLSQFIFFYSEAEHFRKAKAIEQALRKNLALFVKQLKDHLRERADSRCESESELGQARRSKKFSDRATKVLKDYLMSHFDDPYPNGPEKERLAQETGLTVGQVNNWFVNTRERIVKKFYKKESMGLILKKLCTP